MTASATPENYTTLTDVTSAQHCSAAQRPPSPSCFHIWARATGASDFVSPFDSFPELQIS